MRLNFPLSLFLAVVACVTSYAEVPALQKRETAYDSNRSWIAEGRLTEEAYRLLTAIRADSSILCSKDRYNLERIDEMLQKISLSEKHESGVNGVLNRAFMLYRLDRREGCLDPYEIYAGRIHIDERVKRSLEDRENILLRRLEHALRRYEAVEADGGWNRVPRLSRLLKKGDESEAVREIRRRLFESGDLNDSDCSNTLFDESLEEAVKLFQRRHSLKSDGIVGPMTLAAMNTPIERKIALMKLNIERLRWLVRGSEGFIVANIPEFSLTLYRKNSPALTMRTVVGRRERPTPMISDLMSYAVLNPYWRAPETIVREDILPKLKAGEFDYLEKIGLTVSRSMDGNESVDMRGIDWSRFDGGDLPFIFMQKPGPGNYLGFVKFIFPNDLDIYIHDTPETPLFKRKERMMSSGCIRVEKPIELFHALFAGDGGRWSYKQIVKEIIKKREIKVDLAKPLPVYILYMTAYADEKGRVHFLPDIYGYDRTMQNYLDSFSVSSE